MKKRPHRSAQDKESSGKIVVKSSATASPKAPSSPKPSRPTSTVTRHQPPATPTVQKQTFSIIADIDIGFGNTLYIRGNGQNLSWEQGVPMTPITDHQWTWNSQSPIGTKISPFEYKVLINDQTWCTGENFIATRGENIIFPLF